MFGRMQVDSPGRELGRKEHFPSIDHWFARNNHQMHFLELEYQKGKGYRDLVHRIQDKNMKGATRRYYVPRHPSERGHEVHNDP